MALFSFPAISRDPDAVDWAVVPGAASFHSLTIGSDLEDESSGAGEGTAVLAEKFAEEGVTLDSAAVDEKVAWFALEVAGAGDT